MTGRARAAIFRRVGEDGASVTTMAREFGIGWRTAMAAVREHGRPPVADPHRLADVDAIEVDETAFQAAAATRATTFMTGLDLTRGCAPARLLDVVDDHGASTLSWVAWRDPE